MSERAEDLIFSASYDSSLYRAVPRRQQDFPTFVAVFFDQRPRDLEEPRTRYQFLLSVAVSFLVDWASYFGDRMTMWHYALVREEVREGRCILRQYRMTEAVDR